MKFKKKRKKNSHSKSWSGGPLSLLSDALQMELIGYMSLMEFLINIKIENIFYGLFFGRVINFINHCYCIRDINPNKC